MDFAFDPAEEAFRDEVRAFLDEQLGEHVDRHDPQLMTRWLRAVREKRWVGFSWPTEYGGGGGSLAQQVILKEEMARARAPMLGTCFMGLQWVGPAILAYGTEAQKRELLPDILDGTYQWCTGFSEPGVGSDLAALQCRAVRDGVDYVVSGQKIWTSIAQASRKIILLVRTSWDPANKHDGITCLLADMDSPGVSVRPIENMAGYAMFCEVFFDDVRVPVASRLGEEGQGWRVTITSLANERSGIAEVTGMQRKLADLRDLARRVERGGRTASEDPAVRRRLGRFEARVEAMRLNGLRYLTRQLRGEPLGSETSVNKLHKAQLEVEMAEFALELEGPASVLMKGAPGALDDGRWQHDALSWPETVIGGGTPNIQRNIIAERILGLPKD